MSNSTTQCFEHYFVTKSTPGAPGGMWQECELCGLRFKELLAQDHQRIQAELLKGLPGESDFDPDLGEQFDAGWDRYRERATKAIEAVLGTELALARSDVRKEDNHQEGSQ